MNRQKKKARSPETSLRKKARAKKRRAKVAKVVADKTDYLARKLTETRYALRLASKEIAKLRSMVPILNTTPPENITSTQTPAELTTNV